MTRRMGWALGGGLASLAAVLVMVAIASTLAGNDEDRSATPTQSSGAVDASEVNKRLGRGVNILGYDPVWVSPGEGRFQVHHMR